MRELVSKIYGGCMLARFHMASRGENCYIAQDSGLPEGS